MHRLRAAQLGSSAARWARYPGWTMRRPLVVWTCLVMAACTRRAAETRRAEMPEYPPPVAAATARPATTPPVLHQDSGSLTGTRWSGVDSDGDLYSFDFHPNGALHYDSPSGGYDSATWEQHGNRVTWQMNDHYAEYEAIILSDTKMEGSAHNRDGHTWTFTIDKQKIDKQK